MNTIAWKYIMFNSFFFAFISFVLYFATESPVFTWVAWFFLLNEINAAVRWNLYIRKERNARDNI